MYTVHLVFPLCCPELKIVRNIGRNFSWSKTVEDTQTLRLPYMRITSTNESCDTIIVEKQNKIKHQSESTKLHQSST